MVFSSIIFLFHFLPVALAAYYLAPPRYRNVVALVLSLVFYAWGAPKFIFVLLLSAAIDYYLSLFFVDDRQGYDRVIVARRRNLLVLGVSLNIALLAYFKYANFFIGELEELFSAFGYSAFSWSEVALPIGISFFTFQKLSYLVDTYRGVSPPARSYNEYLLYVVMFPQLIAGPIVRYHDIVDQLRSRLHTSQRMLSGIWRFCLGLAKKVIVANTLGQVADQAFAFGHGLPEVGCAWLGLLCYSLQIYYDFSGYSDMAIGLGKMMGFEFPENFNTPYIAHSFTEFWRRWHISLSSWMREYLYFPLGGNRRGAVRTACNLWVVFLLSGVWHGASWNFILWGAYHGLFLSLDKVNPLAGTRRLGRLIGVPLTFVLVMLGWVLFRAEDLPSAVLYYKALFGLIPVESLLIRPHYLDSNSFVILVIAAFFAFLPMDRGLRFFEQRNWSERRPLALMTGQFFCSVLLLLLGACTLISVGFNPFIYFRF
ncbi:MAG: hypothetical protein CSA34_06960 [Desulfobulbus propionicus]|nr:MAG: hypothetical protein CSA34_06960 [Desulfobulbus propionicus]